MCMNAICGSLYAEVVINVESGDARSGERCHLKVESSAFMFMGVEAREEGGRAHMLCDIRSDIDSAVEEGKREDEAMAAWIVVSCKVVRKLGVQWEKGQTRC